MAVSAIGLALYKFIGWFNAGGLGLLRTDAATNINL